MSSKERHKCPVEDHLLVLRWLSQGAELLNATRLRASRSPLSTWRRGAPAREVQGLAEELARASDQDLSTRSAQRRGAGAVSVTGASAALGRPVRRLGRAHWVAVGIGRRRFPSRSPPRLGVAQLTSRPGAEDPVPTGRPFGRPSKRVDRKVPLKRLGRRVKGSE